MRGTNGRYRTAGYSTSAGLDLDKTRFQLDVFVAHESVVSAAIAMRNRFTL